MPVDKSKIKILPIVTIPADIDFNYINSQNWDVPAAVPPDTFLPDPVFYLDKEVYPVDSLPVAVPAPDYEYVRPKTDVTAAVYPDIFLPDPVFYLDKEVYPVDSLPVAVPAPDYEYLRPKTDVPAAIPPDTFPPDPVFTVQKADKIIVPFKETNAIPVVDATQLKTKLPAETKKPDIQADKPLPVITGPAPVTAPVQITNQAPVQNTATNELITTVNELVKKVNQTSTDNQTIQLPLWIKYLLLGVAAFVVIKLIKK
jgi:hypothetical protein